MFLIVSKFFDFFSELFVRSGRILEFIVSGQSDFNLIKQDFYLHRNQRVKNDTIAGKILIEVKKVMAVELSVKLKNPVVLKLVRDPAESPVPFVKNGVGKYHSHMMFFERYHMIYILSDLIKDKFSAIVAHELMHAFLYENNIMIKDKSTREAMARWAEYNYLFLSGNKKEASKMMSISKPELGGGFVKLLSIEKKVGRRNFVSYVAQSPETVYELLAE